MLDALATPVGIVLRTIHSLLSQFLLAGSGPAWALSIVLLTVTVRLLLFPLFVKQIKSQRRMQQIAPKIKELQQRHKGDRETMNTEMMKLYKEHNANPISGCLPLLLQLPVFFALFTVVREFKPGAEPAYGLTAQMLEEGGRAKVFGAPIAAAFNSPVELLTSLDGNAVTVRIVAAVMVLLMGTSTFITQKQMMARAGTGDPQQQQIQKLLLYFLPLSLAVSGFFFPVGVLLYWLTTNVWSMAQQAYVIKRMPMLPGAAGSDDGSGPNGSGPKGSGPNGSGPNGSGPNGSGPKGSKPGTSRLGGRGSVVTTGATSSATGAVATGSVVVTSGDGPDGVPQLAATGAAVNRGSARGQGARRKRGRPGGRR